MRSKQIERKRIIIFGFEGKNNKTESNYYSHFKPADPKYLLRPISCGKTDPQGMISSIKQKRKDYDYNSKEDLTFLFMDCDCNEEKSNQIDKLQAKQGKDLVIIKTNPCFELWFLNHFVLTSKEYKDNKELIKELSEHLPNYSKEKDYFGALLHLINAAIRNSESQLNNGSKCFTHVHELINKILVLKD